MSAAETRGTLLAPEASPSAAETRGTLLALGLAERRRDAADLALLGGLAMSAAETQRTLPSSEASP